MTVLESAFSCGLQVGFGQRGQKAEIPSLRKPVEVVRYELSLVTKLERDKSPMLELLSLTG